MTIMIEESGSDGALVGKREKHGIISGVCLSKYSSTTHGKRIHLQVHDVMCKIRGVWVKVSISNFA